MKTLSFLNPGGVEELGLLVLASLGDHFASFLCTQKVVREFADRNWDVTAFVAWFWDESAGSEVGWYQTPTEGEAIDIRRGSTPSRTASPWTENRFS